MEEGGKNKIAKTIATTTIYARPDTNHHIHHTTITRKLDNSNNHNGNLFCLQRKINQQCSSFKYSL